MGRTVKKRPYMIEKAAAGEWIAADDKEYESRGGAENALKALATVGTYRIIQVCATYNMAVAAVTKVSLSEV